MEFAIENQALVRRLNYSWTILVYVQDTGWENAVAEAAILGKSVLDRLGIAQEMPKASYVCHGKVQGMNGVSPSLQHELVISLSIQPLYFLCCIDDRRDDPLTRKTSYVSSPWDICTQHGLASIYGFVWKWIAPGPRDGEYKWGYFVFRHTQNIPKS